MKKLIWLVIVVVLMTGLIFTGCAQPAPTTTPTTPTTPTTTPAAQPAKVIEWAGQCPLPGGFDYNIFVRFSDRVNKASGGRMKLTAQGGGAVVPAQTEFDGVNNGVLNYGKSCLVYLRDRYPAAAVMPYMIGGQSAMETIMWWREGGGRELFQKMIKDTNVMGDHFSQVSTPETFLWSNKPLKTAADIKGLKIRASGDAGEVFTRMGAAVVNIPGAEVYESMQRGVIDACELACPTIDNSLALFEVAKYAYLSPVRQPLELLPLYVNKNDWAKLTPDLQEIIEVESWLATLQAFAEQVTGDLKAVANFKAKGVTVEPASEEIVNELIRQAGILYQEKAAKDPFVAEVIKSKTDFMKACREMAPRL